MRELTKVWLVGILPSVCRAFAEAGPCLRTAPLACTLRAPANILSVAPFSNKAMCVLPRPRSSDRLSNVCARVESTSSLF